MNMSSQMMNARAKALTQTFRELGIPLECVYTSWEDAMRDYNSCLGPNITDVGLIFRNQEGDVGPAETFGFKVRSNNFNEILVEVDARRFKIVVSDKDGQNPRTVTLAYALEHAGALFQHCGLDPDCNLYHPELDNGKCKLRIDLIFAPKGDCSGGDVGDFATKEFALTAHNYQAREGDARNISLFAHPQGTACSEDGPGTQRLYAQCQVKDGEVSNFWFEAEDTGKKVQDMHTETAAESAAAAARGKGTAVRSGMPGWDKLPNLFHYIQIPREQTTHKRTRGFDNDPTFTYGLSGGLSGGPCVYRSLAAGGDDDDAMPTYRSCSTPSSSANVTSVRLSRGSYAGKARGVTCAQVKRAAEPLTISTTLVVMIDGEEAPKAVDVQSLWKTVERMREAAGDAKELMDPSANLTSATAPPKAPIVGMVVE